jgi:hypothetical protein
MACQRLVSVCRRRELSGCSPRSSPAGPDRGGRGVPLARRARARIGQLTRTGQAPSRGSGGRPAGLTAAGTEGSRLLDGRDLDVEGDLLADQDAAGLEGRVPDDAVVLAVDRGLALEAGADVAVGVLGGADVSEGDGDRVGLVLDGQVAGEVERVGTGDLDVGGGEGLG